MRRQAGDGREQQQIVGIEIDRAARAAALGEIIGAGVEAELKIADRARARPRARGIAAAQRKIEMLGNEIDAAIGHHQLEADLGVQARKAGERAGQRLARDSQAAR